MSLTIAEETWVKNQKQIVSLEKEIYTLNSNAQSQLNTKNTEITAIRDKLSADIKVKTAEVEALKSA